MYGPKLIVQTRGLVKKCTIGWSIDKCVLCKFDIKFLYAYGYLRIKIGCIYILAEYPSPCSSSQIVLILNNPFPPVIMVFLIASVNF